MSLGEVRGVCEDVYAYLQPDGSWYLNNTGFLVSDAGELDGGERGGPLDIARALGEMVAYNSGQPLTCHA
jgi:hypothetical protein